MSSVKRAVESIIAKAESQYTNDRGNEVHRRHWDSERYVIDLADDFAAEGWEQFDTANDAPYFGVWVNRRQRRTLTYCEGDWTVVTCPTDETYRAEIEDAIRVYGDGFIATVIDTEARAATTYVQDRKAMFLDPIGT